MSCKTNINIINDLFSTKFVLVFACLFLVAACTGEKSLKVQAMQKKDKYLSCNEVMLELNEAEFYRRTAEKNKGPKVKSLLMPLGYVSTYIDAEEAINAADSRVDYLNRIYEILECEQNKHNGSRKVVDNGYRVPEGYYPVYQARPAMVAPAAPAIVPAAPPVAYTGNPPATYIPQSYSGQSATEYHGSRYYYNDMM